MLGVLCACLVLITIDNTILNVAIPTLARDLDASGSDLQWIVDSYVLVFAGLLLTAGALGDRFGRAGALRIGLVIFAAGSAAAAWADGTTALIACRALMGLGAALIMPSTLSILANVFTDAAERAKAIAIWSGCAAIGIVLGPVAGGWLLEHFWWGSIFLVNLPLVAVVLVAVVAVVPTSRDESAPPVDKVGAALSIVGLVALLWAIIEAPVHGWTDPTTLGAFAVAAVAAAGFVAWEQAQEHPMLDMGFFRNARFSAASVAITLSFFALMGSMFLLTQYMQSVMGYTALESGVRYLPFAAVMLGVAPASAKLVERVGAKAVVATGLVLIMLGLLAMLRLEADSGYANLLLSQLISAAGLALAFAPATESIMGSLPPAKAGVGSAVNDTTRELGGSARRRRARQCARLGLRRPGRGGPRVRCPAGRRGRHRPGLGGRCRGGRRRDRGTGR